MAGPTIVMTLMVRDEADIIAAMIEHHLAQGVDLIIAADNGSIDGTREILADYAQTGRVELRDHPAQDKNQSAVVSTMASDAATHHGATWVINADADEFFLPVDPDVTLRDALQATPTGIGSFPVPVINMTGEPARTGVAFERLVWRDVREESTLMDTVALHAHPTDNVVHVGRPGVTVQQGNHGVDIPSLGHPDAAHAIEVLHFPWRTYEQYKTKIVNMGRAYEASPTLNPSPKHHGMRDYRFLRAGLLEDFYLVRHPTENPEKGFVHEDRLYTMLVGLVEEGRALCPERLEPLLTGVWEGYTRDDRAHAERVARVVAPLEVENVVALTRWRDLYRAEAARRREAEDVLDRIHRRPEVRLRRFVGRVARRTLGRVRGLRSPQGPAAGHVTGATSRKLEA